MARLRVTPVGFESYGVRSMCTFVETPDVKVLIDAGAALGPRLHRLPHPKEYEARNRVRANIRDCASRADLITVSHYHNDHHTPNYTETVWQGSSPSEAEQIYQDKIVLVKDIRNSINFSQRRRGWMFQRFLKKVAKKYEAADCKMFEFGSTKIRFSVPVPHGEEESGLGWVLLSIIETDDDKFVHASDVQGPMSKLTTRLILKERPKILVLGGPPLYLEGVKVDRKSIDGGLRNAARLTSRVPELVFEHHSLRSNDWRRRAGEVFAAASEAGNRVVTAAEYAGFEPELLEANRALLYEDFPPSPAFVKWSKLPRDKQRVVDPPIEVP